MNSSRVEHHKNRLIIAMVALIVRLIPAFLYYGSWDVGAFATLLQHTLDNNLAGLSDLNYFPTIAIYLWFAGLIASITPLPLAFCIKLIPLLFDACIALLIYDIVRKRMFKSAFQVGLLYALCPVPIMIISIHGQWDSLFLFFLLLSFYIREFVPDSVLKYASFGVLFGYAILLKPVALLFSPFFFSPRQKMRDYSYYQAVAATACVGVLLIALGVLHLLGINLMMLLDTIFHYYNHGVQIFGLPFAFPTSWEPVTMFLKNRFFLLPILALLTMWYYQGKVHIYRLLGICVAVVLSFSGLCPQYLMWLVPFLLIKNMTVWAAIYSFVVSLFYLLFYANPFSNLDAPFQNSLSFASIKPCFALGLPAWIFSYQWVPFLNVLGNIVIPGMCMMLLLGEYKKLRKVLRATHFYDFKATTEQVSNWYVWVNVAIFGIIGASMYWYRNLNLAALFDHAAAVKKTWYITALYDQHVGAVYNGHWLINVITINLFFICAWFYYALRVGWRKNASVKK